MTTEGGNDDGYYDDLLFGRCKRSTMHAIGRCLVLLNVVALVVLAVIMVKYG